MTEAAQPRLRPGRPEPRGAARPPRRRRPTRTRRRPGQAAHRPPVGRLHPATAESGVSTWGGEALLADESLGGEGCPQVAAYAPEPLAITLGVSPGHRQAADHRRPRAAPPPPRDLETRRRPRGPRLEGPPRRRPHPHPPPRGRRVGRPADRPPPAPVRREGRRHRRRPRHRQVRPRPARRTRGPGEEADLGRHPAHPDRVGVRRHQRAPHHRRHPLPVRPLPHALRRTPGRREGRRRPAPRRPQSPGSRHPVHRWSSSDPHRCVEQRAKRAISRDHPHPQTVLYLHLDLTDLDDDLVKAGRAERLGPVTTDKIRDWLGSSAPSASSP